MKLIMKLVLITLLLPFLALAQDDISTSTGIIGNGRLLGAKTYDGQTTVGVLGIDSSGNTTIRSLSGKTVQFPGALDITGAIATGTLTVKPSADANRTILLSAASDTDISVLGGDGGTTATQTFTVATNTADGDDDGMLCLSGGDACATNGTRSGYITIKGNEANGSIQVQSGNVSTGTMSFYAPHASSTIDFGIGSGPNDWQFKSASSKTTFHQKTTAAGDIELSSTGSTLAIQEGTAASACSGTVTANGTTAVTVSTTCATTGSRIFVTRSAAPSGTALCWATNIVNNTSFDFDCSGAETSTYNWVIFHEAPAL